MEMKTRNTSRIWHIFREDDILIYDDDHIHLPEEENPKIFGLEPIRYRETAYPEGEVIKWAEVTAETEPPGGMKFAPRRKVLEVLARILSFLFLHQVRYINDQYFILYYGLILYNYNTIIKIYL